MKHFFHHIRTNIMRGVLAVIPLVLCAIAAAILYQFIDKRMMGLLKQFVDVRFIPGLGTLLLFVLLFLIGFITSNVLGRQVLRWIGDVSARIPVIGAIYSLSKEIGDTLMRSSDHNVLKKAVLIRFPVTGERTVAFVIGDIKDQETGENWLKVYTPMAHPYVGFLFMVKEKDALDPGWPVDEALKTVVSLGILGPKKV